MATYTETLRNKQAELIRKATDGSVLLASLDADPISKEVLFDATGLVALPSTGTIPYGDLGWLTDDGAQFSRDVSNSEITSWGATSPTRTDVTTDSSTLTVACQETKMLTIGLATGMDMSTVTPDANGAIEIKKPVRPSSRSYRVLSVAVDEYNGDEIYIARFMPRAKVSSYSEQSFGGGDEPVMWGVTFTGEEDSDLGYSESWLFGGPGWKALLGQMGFATTPPAAWSASTAYSVNDQVTLTGGEVLRATVAGTSGATEPAAPASVGGTVVDGGVTWERVS